MSTNLLVCLYAVGAALLGFWAVVRLGSLGPQRIVTAVAVVLAALTAQSLAIGALPGTVRSVGPAGAMLLLVLPALTFAFWALGCLIRVFVGLLHPLNR